MIFPKEFGVFPPPTFEQIGLGAVVTFRVNVAGTQLEVAPSRRQVSTKSGPSRYSSALP